MKCFFSESGFSLVEDPWYGLVNSKITWVCCDIALALEPETPISIDNQVANDSMDEDQSDEATIMQDMRAGSLRQLREEMAQQLREESLNYCRGKSGYD